MRANLSHQTLLRAGLICLGVLVGFLAGINTAERAQRAQIQPPDGGGGAPSALRSADDPSIPPPRSSLSPEDEDEEEPSSSSPLAFELPPSVKEVIINVGSNLDPIMPTEAMGPCAHSIAVEPIVHCQIPSHRQLSVLPAAVASAPGATSMRTYNVDALSSSLVRPAKKHWWNDKAERGDGSLALVPVITLSSIIDAIPDTTDISLLKTDMQGFDFVAIREAAPALKARVSHFFSEVWFDDVYSYHATNDLCRDWLPFMTELGYTLAKINDSYDRWKGATDSDVRERCVEQLEQNPERPAVSEASAGLREGDAYWVRNDVLTEPFPECPLLPEAATFTKEQYESCGAM